jgi:carbon monoxide dehydrogenase subunit G
MDMTGEHLIPAPRETVWRALNDPELLKRAIPGCEEVVKLSDTEFTAKVTSKIGPVSAKFAGKVTLSDLDPPNGYRITGEGQGGAAGFAKGGAEVRLEPGPAPNQTLLRYTVNAAVGGKLAQIGSRLIDGAARKTAEQFFGKFAEIVGTEAAAVEAVPATPAEPVAPPLAGAPVPPPGTPAGPAGKEEAGGPGLSPRVWIIALIVVVALLLAVFGFDY